MLLRHILNLCKRPVNSISRIKHSCKSQRWVLLICCIKYYDQKSSNRLLQGCSFANSTLLSWTKHCSALSRCIQPAIPRMFTWHFLWMQHCLASRKYIQHAFPTICNFQFQAFFWLSLFNTLPMKFFLPRLLNWSKLANVIFLVASCRLKFQEIWPAREHEIHAFTEF